MRFTIAAAASAALFVGVQAATNGTSASAYVGDAYVTEVVTAYTTVCPSATELVHNGVTYTATAVCSSYHDTTGQSTNNAPQSQTITVTNCPCTVTYPAPAATASAAKNGTVPAAGTGSPVSPAKGSSTTSPATFTGAATKLSGAGAALAGIFAVAAYAL